MERAAVKAVFAVAVLALPLAAGADEVYLRGGGRLNGVVVERTAEAVVVDVGPGQVTVSAAQVERIVGSTPLLALYRERQARLSPSDLDGWLRLGVWARERDLLTQARQAFEHALAIDPGNAVAHRQLGHVLVDGRWMTPEEGYRARGLVDFEGSWVTPQERVALVSQRAAEVQARQAEIEAAARAREAEARARTAEAEARRAEMAAAAPREGIPLGMMGYSPYPYGIYGPVVTGAIVGGFGFGRPFPGSRVFHGLDGSGVGFPGRCPMTPGGPHSLPPSSAQIPFPVRAGFAPKPLAH